MVAPRVGGAGLGQLFAEWSTPGVVRVQATAAGQMTLDLERMLGLQDPHDIILEANGTPLQYTRAGGILVFPIQPGIPVELHLGLTAVDAKIAILWPHGDVAVVEAKLANLTAYLTYPGTRMAVPCDLAPEVTLWSALNNEPATKIATGGRRLAEFGGRRVPVWDFNDVDVSAARDPKNKLYFSVRVAGASGVPCRANVWVHGVDARTYMPLPLQATGILKVASNAVPAEIDARIQIVWPHGGAPVTEARLANITADLFAHGTRKRLGGEAWQPAVWLVRAVDNGVGERVARATPRAESDGSAHWDFNDVDVSAARDPSSLPLERAGLGSRAARRRPVLPGRFQAALRDRPCRAPFTSPTVPTDAYTLQVTDSSEPLRVVLTWTDYPSTPAASVNLVNDLDLTMA